MSQLTFVLGKTGTGKSTSLRNFTAKDGIGYVTATGKPLPFKSDIPQFHARSYTELTAVINQAEAPVVVIDDFNYLMSFEEFSKSSIKGYEKFTEMAVNVVNIIDIITKKETDQRFYILAHSENNDNNELRLKTTGKMVSDKFVPEGLTNQVVETAVVDGEFVFKVKTDGTGIKTPIGMFATDTIPNDLKVLDESIRAFYAPVKEGKK
jgi:hypothetical protein